MVCSLSLVACELAALGYDNILGGLVAALGGEILDFSDNGFAIQDFTENNMLAVEVRGRDSCDEELGSIGAYLPKSAQSPTQK